MNLYDRLKSARMNCDKILDYLQSEYGMSENEARSVLRNPTRRGEYDIIDPQEKDWINNFNDLQRTKPKS